MPLAMALVATFAAMNGAPERMWSPASWLWNGQSPDVPSGWFIALALFAVGAALFLRDGAKNARGDEE